jgi:hypothetical protein
LLEEFRHFHGLYQEARSGGAAHRKGHSYKNVVTKLGLEKRPTQEVFTELLQGAITMLRGLKAFFLAAPGGSAS